jgi:hypothetical protein
MAGETLGIIRIQAAKRPSCRVEPTVVRAIVIPGRRILMDHASSWRACAGTRTLQLLRPGHRVRFKIILVFLDLRFSVRV